VKEILSFLPRKKRRRRRKNQRTKREKGP